MSEPMKLTGTVEHTIRFEVPDLVSAVKAYPKEWLELTKDELRSRGGYSEVDRLPVFLDGLLEASLDVFGHDTKHLSFRIDWDDTHYRWNEQDAQALMDALPPKLQFEDGYPAEPKPEAPEPMDGDQPLFDLEET